MPDLDEQGNRKEVGEMTLHLPDDQAIHGGAHDETAQNTPEGAPRAERRIDHPERISPPHE